MSDYYYVRFCCRMRNADFHEIVGLTSIQNTTLKYNPIKLEQLELGSQVRLTQSIWPSQCSVSGAGRDPWTQIIKIPGFYKYYRLKMARYFNYVIFGRGSGTLWLQPPPRLWRESDPLIFKSGCVEVAWVNTDNVAVNRSKSPSVTSSEWMETWMISGYRV